MKSGESRNNELKLWQTSNGITKKSLRLKYRNCDKFLDNPLPPSSSNRHIISLFPYNVVPLIDNLVKFGINLDDV